MTPQLRSAEKGILNFFYQRKIRRKPEMGFTLKELQERFCIPSPKTRYPMSRDALQIALRNMRHTELLEQTGSYYYLTAKGTSYAAKSLKNHIDGHGGEHSSR